MKSFDRVAVAVAALLVSLGSLGCSNEPLSAAAFEHAQSLYTVGALRAASAVEAAEEEIAADFAAGALDEREADRLNEICRLCRAERWDEAQSAARSMMQDAGRS